MHHFGMNELHVEEDIEQERSCRYREPTREEHLLVDRILFDPFRRADSGEERSHGAPTETPENRVSLNPLETRFEIREKTK
ncbi:hypothetical protein F2Q68_00004374 [Brassica cretica]|uniref:Uncharacterized protein n=1 Tax=Brassica cretica TaxID=69181 RepID=A0A8S9J8J7_BRACR|nr:hypothetical protein F2Q68_00004374 [Brassica cretica]